MTHYRFAEDKHLHSLDGKPLIGTTTALSVVEKPLTWWASGQAVGAMGWLNPKKHDANDCLVSAGVVLTEIKLETVGDYVNRLNKAYRAHHDLKEKRAGEGTDLHALAEEYIGLHIKGQIPLFVDPKLKAFVDWCNKNVHRFLFSEIHCYSERLWVGGKTDFGFEDMEGNWVLADIKSRDKDYFTDHLQCGLYDIQLSENGGFDKDGNKIWETARNGGRTGIFQQHAIFTMGEKFTEPVFSKSVYANKDGGEHALELYKIRQQFEDK